MKIKAQSLLFISISFLPIILLAYLSYQKTLSDKQLIAEQEAQLKQLSLGKVLNQLNSDVDTFIKNKFNQIQQLTNTDYPAERFRQEVLSSDVEFILYYQDQQRVYPPPESKHQLLDERDVIYRFEPVVSEFIAHSDQNSSNRNLWHWLSRTNSKSLTYCEIIKTNNTLCVLVSLSDIERYVNLTINRYLTDYSPNSSGHSLDYSPDLSLSRDTLGIINQSDKSVWGSVNITNNQLLQQEAQDYPLKGWQLFADPLSPPSTHITGNWTPIWTPISHTLLSVLPLMIGWAVLVALYYRFQSNRELMMQEKIDLVATLSHELKTPVANIKLYLDLLQHKKNNLNESQQTHFYQVIDSELERFDRLISNALAYNQSDSTSQFSIKNPTNPDQLIRQLIASFSLKASENRCSINEQLSINQQIRTNSSSLSLIISNLIDNALKYAPGSKIEVSSKILDQNYYELRVKDNGKGFGGNPMSLLHAQLKPSTNGFGIGLPAVNRIAQLNQGHVSIRNPITGGAEIIVVLSYE